MKNEKGYVIMVRKFDENGDGKPVMNEVVFRFYDLAVMAYDAIRQNNEVKGIHFYIKTINIK